MGLIWLSRRGDRGPKSPQKYSLTPLGCLAALRFCELDKEVDAINITWKEVCPKTVLYWRKYFESKCKEDLIEATNNLLFQILTLKKKNVKPGKEKIHKFVVARARDFVRARSAAMFQRSVNTHSVGWPRIL